MYNNISSATGNIGGPRFNPPPPGCVDNPTLSNRQARPFVRIGEEHLSHLSIQEYGVQAQHNSLTNQMQSQDSFGRVGQAI